MATYLNDNARKPRANERHEWKVVPTLPQVLQVAKENLMSRILKGKQHENRIL